MLNTDQNDEKSSKFLKLAPRLALIFYLAGLGYGVFLLVKANESRTHFHENALLPGLVDEQFEDEHAIKEIYLRIRQFFVADRSKKWFINDRTVFMLVYNEIF